MRRKWIVLAFAGILSVQGIAAQTIQDIPFYAWVYHPETQALWQVDQQGTVSIEVTLTEGIEAARATIEESFQDEFDSAIAGVEAYHAAQDSDENPALIDTYEPTGEIISAYSASDFDRISDTANNAIRVFSPALGSEITVFHTPDFDIQSLDFIQGGEMMLLSLGDQDDTTDDPLIMLSRDREFEGTMPTMTTDQLGSVYNVKNGFLYTTYNLLNIVITPDGLDDGDLVAFFDVQTDEIAADELVIVYAKELLRSTLGPFEPWTDLVLRNRWVTVTDDEVRPMPAESAAEMLENASIEQDAISAMMQAAGGNAADSFSMISALAIGMNVIITPEGSPASLYLQPSKTGMVMGAVEAGLPLTIIDGPIEADGVTFWQVSSPFGLTGWVIESENGVLFLIAG
jgi:hypothetical protein